MSAWTDLSYPHSIYRTAQHERAAYAQSATTMDDKEFSLLVQRVLFDFGVCPIPFFFD